MIGLTARQVCVAPIFALAVVTLVAASSWASTEDAENASTACGPDESWDNAMSMCMPSAGASRSQTVLSGQFNAFGVLSALQGPRGVDQFAAPNMFMIDVGRGIGTRQFVNLDLMGTAELWTYPRHGYPQLLQVGEEQGNGTPFIDAQHPHSSPIMGLTLSDTVALAEAESLKLFFAPRGESTDGPIAYVHRESSRDDPDAPLGHHVGQDVGHVSSTVLGAQLDLGSWILETSAFNGTEPSPTKVDLPLGPLDSEAFRVTYVIDSAHRVLASVAHVEQTDPLYPGTTSATRSSGSVYDHLDVSGVGSIDHTFVVGSIARHPGGPTLTSLLDEAVLKRGASELWERFEILQRLSSELRIPAPFALTGEDEKRWVSALTVGYTHWTPLRAGLEIGLGSSVTVDRLPAEWVSAYGYRMPLTVRLIVQVRGAGRWQR